jgi:D-alanyl-D-alanine carboxypeptidase/D-alanyl-D-alanine-endopeptidase (penicillin-binding protein 4)
VNICLPPYAKIGVIEGTIPAGDSSTIASGSTPNPYYQLGKVLEKTFDTAQIKYKQMSNSLDYMNHQKAIPHPDSVFYTYLSPSLDSITYWFLHKSVNLYGEAILKEMAYSKMGEGSTEAGIGIVKKFWDEKGIELSALRIKDGSGLSTTNRITTNSLVKILQYAYNQSWFSSFYYALPLYNGMKLKSGTIGGIKSFAGYHTSKDGVNYTIAFIVNNFSGYSSEMTKKMFRVLDELK